MGLSEDGEDAVERRFEEICLDLNMDKHPREESWNNYRKIRENYTLEGDQLHWLACALYEACRRSVVPTVGKGTIEGNCVSLTRLLRSAGRFSLIQFFNKMRKWSDMANLPQEFRDKVNRLERNFAVSTVIFKKFEPIFLDIFRSPLDEPPKQNRSRKQRRLPCSSTDVFNFCWTMFVQVKGNFPAISDDLVNSYHLLLACVDWFYANALLGGRKDLLNTEFAGLPDNYHNKDWKPPTEPPCIIKLLCEKHEGLELEAKVIKEHWWKPHIRKLFDKKVLKGKPDTLSAILEIGNFEANSIAINQSYEEFPLRYSSKTINNRYEEYVLSVGDFDERIFLGDDADEEIGTPAKASEEVTGEFSDRMNIKNNLQQHFEETRSLAPLTPLTGRRYLKEKDHSITPVSTATQSVGRLQHLLSGRKTGPSEELLQLFQECKKDPNESIIPRLKEMGDIFCSHYVQATEDHPGAHIDFAKRRLQLGESLYFKTLESVIMSEKKRRQGSKEGMAAITALLEQDMFHRSLIACCLEVVIFSYNSQRMFPWIVEIFELNAYHFYKVVEIIIRAEEGLSRDMVKHLNHIEESILECHAWKNESPLWDTIKDQNSTVPACEEVILPSQLESVQVNSPMVHPAVKRLVDEGRSGQQQQQQQQQPVTTIRESLPSPPGATTMASDRFSSPSPGSAKRRLFITKHAVTSQGDGEKSETTTTVTTSTSSTVPTQIIAFQQAQTEDGRHVLIPVHTILSQKQSNAGTTTTTTTTTTSISSSQPANKPKKTGSLALFFRKMYHLASVRLRDLCDRLQVDDEDLRQKMWTCFEHTLVHHTDLMMDRHIDQMIMCAIYVMAKVTDHPQSFQNIMKCYRLQPQAQSHVYRSVLISGRRRRTSGSSDSSKNGTSGSSSPVPEIKEEVTTKRKSGEIRSSSTLPVPHPSSHPPTPTRLLSTGPGFDLGEERGDLIMFYNMVYVGSMKKFAMKFSSQSHSEDCPPLSPLPMSKVHPSSPRRVSGNHCVYISPHKLTNSLPSERMLYCFQRSPAKDLRAINRMIKMKEKNTSFLGKRILNVDKDNEGPSPAKQMYQGISLMRRLQNLNSDRQENAQ
ncbi:retinoblastoma-like protein 1 isoform X1 [Mizuhopecten yessoensis]|uniref:Retinoblastoma-like protein 1 n=1 Tax=Mizuhopecten yessoensis TaxID=6573 RepID=A0A210R2R8_MIZYE|nr:retinoblastoma-like protein 1 isoform X1 [Mizuhopecten yessoensis]OWF55242.1 Retinoblastoma-like protein 1 [Mizuhopecten yessoensis]